MFKTNIYIYNLGGCVCFFRVFFSAEAQEHIPRFEVSMHDTVSMEMHQSLGDLRGSRTEKIFKK